MKCPLKPRKVPQTSNFPRGFPVLSRKGSFTLNICPTAIMARNRTLDLQARVRTLNPLNQSWSHGENKQESAPVRYKKFPLKPRKVPKIPSSVLPKRFPVLTRKRVFYGKWWPYCYHGRNSNPRRSGSRTNAEPTEPKMEIWKKQPGIQRRRDIKKFP